MRKCLLILATCSAGAVAWSQSAPSAMLESANNSREQRRAELRTILQAYRQRAATATDAAAVERHLTEQERAEIRQQLRQNRTNRPKQLP